MFTTNTIIEALVRVFIVALVAYVALVAQVSLVALVALAPSVALAASCRVFCSCATPVEQVANTSGLSFIDGTWPLTLMFVVLL